MRMHACTVQVQHMAVVTACAADSALRGRITDCHGDFVHHMSLATPRHPGALSRVWCSRTTAPGEQHALHPFNTTHCRSPVPHAPRSGQLLLASTAGECTPGLQPELGAG